LEQFCHNLLAQLKLIDNHQHSIKFISKCDCSIACVDKKLLHPILANLLSNAIKYSPINSTIELKLFCHNQDIIFQIKDEGIGIPIADQLRLFEPFHRGKNVGDIPGTGLGLSVVKKFVDVHGGQITVASEVGKGTTFRVTLPLNQSMTVGVSSLD
jgi:signal transduction histidine kinase